MNLPKIVCPHNRSLLQSLKGCTLAVRTPSIDHVSRAAADVSESGNYLFCVILDIDRPFDEVELGQELKDIPLVIMVPSLGKFRTLAKRVKILRALNIRVFLPCDKHENVVALRILSSLRIRACADFRNGKQDWNALADLMTYAILERTLHTPIEPFAYIALHYDPFVYIDWSCVYFEGPGQFLHLDGKGRVALSHIELLNQTFIAQNLSEISAADEFPAIGEMTEAWRRFFVDGHPCAFCGGWKLCLGKFSAGLPENNGCKDFFLEMMEVARQYKAQQVVIEESRIWQP